jgi:hypothetical protein
MEPAAVKVAIGGNSTDREAMSIADCERERVSVAGELPLGTISDVRLDLIPAAEGGGRVRVLRRNSRDDGPGPAISARMLTLQCHTRCNTLIPAGT